MIQSSITDDFLLEGITAVFFFPLVFKLKTLPFFAGYSAVFPAMISWIILWLVRKLSVSTYKSAKIYKNLYGFRIYVYPNPRIEKYCYPGQKIDDNNKNNNKK